MVMGHSYGAMVEYNSQPVIIGGVDVQYNKGVERLNSNNKWKSMESLPYAMEGHSAITVENIYVFGKSISFC